MIFSFYHFIDCRKQVGHIEFSLLKKEFQFEMKILNCTVTASKVCIEKKIAKINRKRSFSSGTLLTVPLGPLTVPIHLKMLSPSGKADTSEDPDI